MALWVQLGFFILIMDALRPCDLEALNRLPSSASVGEGRRLRPCGLAP